MNKTIIFKFKKFRNIDQIIEASLSFFRNFIKPILLILWKNNKLLIIATFISYFLYNYYAFHIFNFDLSKNKDAKNIINQYSIPSILSILIFFIFYFNFYLRYMLTVFAFIHSYINNKGKIKETEIKKTVTEKFWPFFKATFLLILLIILIGIIASLIFILLSFINKSTAILLTILISLPVIMYLSTLLSIYYPVYFYENITATKAISIAIKYLKEKFWYSFSIIFIIGLIITIIGIIFNIPLYIYTFSKTILAFENKENFTQNFQGNILQSSFATLSFAGQTFLKALSLIGFSMLFFSIKEYHTAEGTFEKIENIGKTKEKLD